MLLAYLTYGRNTIRGKTFRTYLTFQISGSPFSSFLSQVPPVTAVTHSPSPCEDGKLQQRGNDGHAARPGRSGTGRYIQLWPPMQRGPTGNPNFFVTSWCSIIPASVGRTKGRRGGHSATWAPYWVTFWVMALSCLGRVRNSRRWLVRRRWNTDRRQPKDAVSWWLVAHAQNDFQSVGTLCRVLRSLCLPGTFITNQYLFQYPVTYAPTGQHSDSTHMTQTNF